MVNKQLGEFRFDIASEIKEPRSPTTAGAFRRNTWVGTSTLSLPATLSVRVPA